MSGNDPERTSIEVVQSSAPKSFRASHYYYEFHMFDLKNSPLWATLTLLGTPGNNYYSYVGEKSFVHPNSLRFLVFLLK